MRYYLDHAASAPLRASARAAMGEVFELVGNPSSLHTAGRRARARLESAREQLAAAIDAVPAEVVFTSGGTEADNLAVLGAVAAGPASGRTRVAVARVEHPAVTGAARSLGDRAHWLGVDDTGVVTSASLAGLPPGLAVVSVQWVNQETGALQPVGEAVASARRAGALAHSDGVQALGHVPVSFADSGLDALSLSAHKVGGPVGIGALVVRRDAALAPVGFGGGQERRLRSGTVPVALAAGFAAAASEAVSALPGEAPRLAALRGRLVAGLRGLPGVRVNGPERVSPAICHATFHGCRADDLLLLLDAAGFDCSTGSACTAGVHQPSEVLLAMGRSEADATSSLRVSFGPGTGADAVAALLGALPDAVARARAAAS